MKNSNTIPAIVITLISAFTLGCEGGWRGDQPQQQY